MKTIKPQKLGILSRCFEFKRKNYFAVSILMYIPLAERAELYSEVSMWKFAAAELGKDGALDAGIPKAKPEFLVAGWAHVPGGQAKQGCSVKARLGALEKELYVYGDRVWRGSIPGDPVPFTSMRVDWAHAFGGEGFEHNPAGKGFKPVTVDGVTLQWLPNVLYPADRLTSPDKRPDPAGFGPMDIAWPQRFTKAGTHDDNWLKEDFPGFARDIEWTIFNTASPDQWFEKALKGDEAYAFQNMHPEKTILEGRLPGFVSRCFINKKTEEGEKFEEVPTRLSTIWFFPHAERAILIHQGMCEVADEDAKDIAQVLIAAERLGEPKGPEYYRDVMRQRLDKEKGPLYALRDVDLLPPGLVSLETDEDKDLLEGKGLIRRNMQKRAVREIEKARAMVAGYGLDPDLHGPKLPGPEEPLPDMDHLSEFIDRKVAEAEAQKKAAEEGKALSLKAIEEKLTGMGMDFEVIRKEISQSPKGPPTFSAQAQIDALKDIAARLGAQGIAAQEVEAYIADEAFCNRLFDGERKLKEAYRFTAHHQDAALPMEQEKVLSVRESVQVSFAQGKSFAGLDLTGADLSDMDLNGVDFEGAFLESVNFTGASLEGSNLKNAVLAHAVLQGARLNHAVLEGANLGGAQLSQAEFVGVNLTGAIMAKADLSGACFNGAQMKGADLSGATFKGTDFSEVQADQLTFLETDLKGLMLKSARMEKCSFLKCDVSGVDFEKASLKSAVFVEVKGHKARFAGTDMENVRFVQQCDFDSSDFTGACLNKANLRGCSLNGCDFTQARLDGADLSECRLNKAKFYRSIAREARFVKADLQDAVMTSINAMNATFQRANICGADLRGANLYQVDLARVHADTKTQLQDALSKKVRIYPRRIS
jgi:uncharacterized protein YjbI with pentapeptide repeats